MIQPTKTQIIEIDRTESVQEIPDVKNNKLNQRLFLSTASRGPLLPAYGSRERERALLDYYRNDYNTMFRAATMALIKRLQSTPYEIQGDDNSADYFQAIFMNADFGRGWSSFLGKLIKDYLRFDGGAYIELIAPGNPLEPIHTAIAGLAVLDSLRCYPTGDPEYPIVYYDVLGGMHVLHTTRVIRVYDGQDSDEYSFGYGECALSRCISAVVREVLINRYTEQQLDDNFPPGILIFKNITDTKLRQAIKQMEDERSTDFRGTWGRTVKLFGLDTSTMPEVESVPFSNSPEKFDLIEYKNLNAREIASGIGIDVQDFWEITQRSNLGTATQSEILHQKAKGNTYGTLLKTLERALNQALPEYMEFAFQYKDPEEDEQEANKAAIWINNASQILASSISTSEQVQRLLANQVPALKDVLTDESGRIIRLPDDDPKAPGQSVPQLPDVPEQQIAEDVSISDTGDKALSATQSSFKGEFERLVSLVIRGELSKAAVRPALRLQLVQNGADALLDGLRDGGVEQPELDDESRQVFSEWRSRQSGYLAQFVDEIFKRDLSQQEISRRADMWVNKSINEIYYIGLDLANKQARYMWIINPVKEHCKTCSHLNGQIHRMKDYIKSGLLPQSTKLACGGYQCGCSLKSTKENARGRLPKYKSLGNGILHTVLNWKEYEVINHECTH